MVHHKRNQSRWAPKETNKTYNSEFTKAGIRRTYSEETDLSETSRYSSNSSGDESWSDMSPTYQGKTKLSGEAAIFVPQQPVQGSGEQRTRLSSGASAFVPGQMMSQQVAPAYTTQMSPSPANGPFMLMPQMMPMDQAQMMPLDQANVMPHMAPYYNGYMAQEGCYFGQPSGECPIAMPVILGTTCEPPLPFEAPQACTEAPIAPAEQPTHFTSKPNPCTPKANASGKSRWADLEDDDETEDPWLH